MKAGRRGPRALGAAAVLAAHLALGWALLQAPPGPRVASPADDGRPAAMTAWLRLLPPSPASPASHASPAPAAQAHAADMPRLLPPRLEPPRVAAWPLPELLELTGSAAPRNNTDSASRDLSVDDTRLPRAFLALTGAASTAAETQTAQTAQTAQTPPAPAAAPPVSADAPRAAAPSAPARVHQVAEHRQCQSAPYPAVLRERGIQGELRLRVHVGPDGQAAAVQLVASSGWRLFDEAALAQARGCRFRPAIEGDKPVAAWVEFPVRFSLGG
jgi:protein TonB